MKTGLIQHISLHWETAALTKEQRFARLFLLAIASYFILQIVFRVTLTDTLAMDEAEQVLDFQRLRLGYGTQPPLYAWLQWFFFKLFGVSLFALMALKNLLIFLLCFSLFRTARPMLGVKGAAAVSASLIFMPEISWDAQRDLTHTVLLTAVASATLWCYFALLRKQSWQRYLLFGLLIGLGLLSKYNYAVFVGGLGVASLLVPEHRQAIWNRKLSLTFAIAALCLLPHGLWVIGNIGAASGGTLNKMREGIRLGSYLSNVLRGFGSMLYGMLDFLTPIWLIYLLACRRYLKRAGFVRRVQDASFFAWLYLVFLVLMSVILLTGEVSNIKGRWMQHLLFMLPLALFVIFPGLQQATVFRNILRVAGLAAIAILLFVAVRDYAGIAMGKNSRKHHPYPQLARELDLRFPTVNTLVVGEKLAAGNLSYQRPAQRTYFLNSLLVHSEPLSGQVLLVWPASMQEDFSGRFQDEYPGSAEKQQGQIDLFYRHSSEKMPFRYALVDIPKR